MPCYYWAVASISVRLFTHISTFIYPYQYVYLPISVRLFTFLVLVYLCTYKYNKKKVLIKVFNMSKSDLVVKTNQLNSAVQNLSLPELRIISWLLWTLEKLARG